MTRGTPTGIPGVTRDGDTYIVRLSTRVGHQRKEVQKRFQNISKTELRRRVSELQTQLDEDAERARLGLKKKETLSDFAKRWLVDLAKTGRGRKPTISKHLGHLERFVLPSLGHVEVRKLRRSHLASWMATLSQRRQPSGKRKGEPYRHNSLLSVWATLRAMVRRAVVLCDLPSDPTTGMRFEVGDHVGDEARPRRRVKEVLTTKEVRALIAAAVHETPDIRAMMIVGFATGLRWAELSALEWDDIRLDAGMLRIERSQVNGHVGPPKTESTRRDVYLAPAVVDVLRAHRRWQVEKQVAGLKKGRVFPAANGRYRYPAIIVKPLARCCALAKIGKRLTAHCMRKTANNLLRQVAGDTVARAMIGHSTEEMTRLYSDVDRDERAKAHAAAFGQAFEGVVGLSGGTRSIPPETGPQDGSAEKKNP